MQLLGHPYVEYDGRKSMRSLADALTKLREEHHLDEGQNVTIKSDGRDIARWPLERLRIGVGPATIGRHQDVHFHAVVREVFGEGHLGGLPHLYDLGT